MFGAIRLRPAIEMRFDTIRFHSGDLFRFYPEKTALRSILSKDRGMAENEIENWMRRLNFSLAVVLQALCYPADCECSAAIVGRLWVFIHSSCRDSGSLWLGWLRESSAFVIRIKADRAAMPAPVDSFHY